MKIIVNLSNLKTKEDVTFEFNKALNFGCHKNGKPVGIGNWDAFNDCFSWLEEGGIYGGSKKITFPFALEIRDFDVFKKNEPKNFSILKEILEDAAAFYLKNGKKFLVIFN